MPPTNLIQNLAAQYLDLVYAAALRQTRHDPHAAADVTQAVFLITLQKAQANRLPQEAHMAGWLLKVTHFAVKQARRAALRRALHESRAITPGESPDLTDQSTTKSEAIQWASRPTRLAALCHQRLRLVESCGRRLSGDNRQRL
jgi:hypothetical protein